MGSNCRDILRLCLNCQFIRFGRDGRLHCRTKRCPKKKVREFLKGK